MAYFDTELDRYVIRVVYDGAPMSGKTTSLLTLSDLLGNRHSSTVYTPESVSERTLFFDWLDYDGGLYNGKSIRCQIVSVPGQKALESRRQMLLDTADSVVFVLDSTKDAFQDSVSCLNGLFEILKASQENAPAILIQANKRDLEAVPMDDIRSAASAGSNVGIIPSSALSGDGVRQSFVLGVGLALDRIAIQESQGLLQKKAGGEISSGKELLDWIRQSEGDRASGTDVAPDAHKMEEISGAEDTVNIAQEFTALVGSGSKVFETNDGSHDKEDGSSPLPAADVPAGMIWPPVKGRLVVNEASTDQDQDQDVEFVEDCWVGQSENWQVSSREADVFENSIDARVALISQVRNYIRLDGLLSSRRAVALSKDGARWRLWQIAGRERSVAESLRVHFQSDDPIRVADLIFRYSELVIQASRLFHARGVDIPVDASSIGSIKGQPVYLGLLPPESDTDQLDNDADNISVDEDIRRMMTHASVDHQLDIPIIIDRLSIHAGSSSDSAVIVNTAASVLIGH